MSISDLAGEVVGAGRLERRRGAAPLVALTTSSAPAAASAKVASATSGWSAAQAENGGLPMPSGSVRAERGLRVAGADGDVVAEVGQPAGDGPADHAGAEDCDVHGVLLERVIEVDRSVYRCVEP